MMPVTTRPWVTRRLSMLSIQQAKGFWTQRKLDEGGPIGSDKFDLIRFSGAIKHSHNCSNRAFLKKLAGQFVDQLHKIE
ncbi:hypothetical protein VARIO8X_50578 [Burkholderiales bacterium 8X]|nr:hypothetical protein VARIO8X_50578 [Burkholderiales bacterium 8X]